MEYLYRKWLHFLKQLKRAEVTPLINKFHCVCNFVSHKTIDTPKIVTILEFLQCLLFCVSLKYALWQPRLFIRSILQYASQAFYPRLPDYLSKEMNQIQKSALIKNHPYVCIVQKRIAYRKMEPREREQPCEKLFCARKRRL